MLRAVAAGGCTARAGRPAEGLAATNRAARRAAARRSARICASAEQPWQDDMLRYERQHSTAVAAPQGAPPIVLLPGFGNCTEDYTAPFGDEEASIAAALQRRGFSVYVLPLTRKDWFKVARALLTPAFYTASSTTHPGYSWYLERVKDLVDTARLETGADQVDLVAHSAGGWLARAFIGQQQYKGPPELLVSADTLGSGDLEPNPAVRSLVTLGTPHTPPPPDKVRDMTGGALTWVNATWPGAAFAGQGVRYVCAGGRAVRGNSEADRQTVPGYAHGSYQQVCGEGHGVEGDAVVPLQSALLEGAEHVVLDGVFHSMSRVRTFNEPADVPWYGSEEVVDTWLHYLAKSP